MLINTGTITSPVILSSFHGTLDSPDDFISSSCGISSITSCIVLPYLIQFKFKYMRQQSSLGYSHATISKRDLKLLDSQLNFCWVKKIKKSIDKLILISQVLHNSLSMMLFEFIMETRI